MTTDKSRAQPQRTHGRVLALDGVRGLAVLLVIACHFTVTRVPYGGVVGVTLFFLLSGYLITGLLLSEVERSGRIDLKAFYLRRVLRLMPALLLVLAATPAIQALVRDPRIGSYPRQALFAGVYLSDYARTARFDMGVLQHTWSLAVEEQFYLLWPAVLVGLIALAARRRVPLRFLLLAILAVALLWRVIASFVLSDNWVQYSFDTTAYALLAGGAAAAWFRDYPPRWATAWVGWTALTALVVLSVSTGPFLHGSPVGTWKWAEVATAALGVPLLAAASRNFRPLQNAVLRWFGRISYGLYLWHFVLLNVYPSGHELTAGQRILPLLLSVGIAAASWYFYESPILRLKRRLETGRSQSRTVPRGVPAVESA